MSSKTFGVVPQQPERLGVLPIKLRGGLGQPPKTLHQVPRGSEGMEPVPNVRFREVPKWRFHSWNVRFRKVPKSRFHSWNVRFREVPKWRFHSWNVRFRKVPKSRFHSWNVRSFFEIWYVFAYNMFFVSHSMFSITHNMSTWKTVPVHQLLGFSHGLILFAISFVAHNSSSLSRQSDGGNLHRAWDALRAFGLRPQAMCGTRA